MVHFGVNKMLSDGAIIGNYQTAIFFGIKSYHKYALENMQPNHLNVALPPVEISLNKYNISQAQTAILDAYRYDQPDSIYKVQKSPQWSLMHNGISKFSTEYNGVCLRGINDKNEPVNVPYCLSKMRGGVNAFETGKMFSFRSGHLVCMNMIAPS